MRKMFCPMCGSEIVFLYTIPTRCYKIEEEKIVEDKSWVENEMEDYILKFQCSSNSNHDIDTDEIIDWSEEVNDEYFDKFYSEENK